MTHQETVQRVEMYFSSVSDIPNNSWHDPQAYAMTLTSFCSFEEDPNKKKQLLGLKKYASMKITIHVWLKRAIVDESKAARIDLGELKLFNITQRCEKC